MSENEEIKRTSGGKFAPGQSGNPAGRKPGPKVSSKEAREYLPLIVIKMVQQILKDPTFLERLQQADPAKYATVLTTLIRYEETDQEKVEAKPPIEISMSTMSNEEHQRRMDEQQQQAGLKAEKPSGPEKAEPKGGAPSRFKVWFRKLFPDKKLYDEFLAWRKRRADNRAEAVRHDAELDESFKKLLFMSDDINDDNYDPDCDDVWHKM